MKYSNARYSLFVRPFGCDKRTKWQRITTLALSLNGARSLFQGIMLNISLSGRGACSLRRVSGDVTNPQEVEQIEKNRATYLGTEA